VMDSQEIKPGDVFEIVGAEDTWWGGQKWNGTVIVAINKRTFGDQPVFTFLSKPRDLDYPNIEFWLAQRDKKALRRIEAPREQ
jgi:hypothetical protein